MKKSEFKDLLSLAMEESCFILNNILYKQIDRVAMASPLEPSLVNEFLAHDEQRYKPLYHQQYIDDIFVLFKWSDFKLI